MELNSANIKKILFIILCGAVIFTAFQNPGTAIALVTKIISFFAPVIAALCISFVLNILLTALETKVFKFWDKAQKNFLKKLKRPFCLVLTYLVAFGIITLLVWVVIPDIIETVTYLANRLPTFVTDAKLWLQDILVKFNLTQIHLPDLEINWTAIGKNIATWINPFSL